MTYPLQGSNSFGSGNVFLIKIKIKTLNKLFKKLQNYLMILFLNSIISDN